MGNRNWWKVALLLAFFGVTAGCGGGGGGEGGPVTPAGLGICSNAAGLVPNTFIVEVKISDDLTDEIEIEFEIEDAADDSKLRLSGETKHLLKDALRGFVMTLPEGENPERFFEDNRVLRVEQDVEAKADVAFSFVRAPVNIPVQQVPTGVRRIGADAAAPAGLGEVGIAILDSGIDLGHPDLNVSILGANIVNPAAPPADTFGHGTHVAGIAAALDNGIGVVGVAPGATLHPVKVLGDDGNGTMSDIIAGLDWVVANADKVAVANLSLHVTCPSPLLRDAVARAVAAGVVVVASAGNVGDDLYGADGIYGTVDDRAPACFPDALTVSAMADFDGQPGGLATGAGEQDDTLVSYSNSSRSLYPGALWTPPGMGIDLAAPGYAILSTFPGGLYETMSGTSMAAPHVTGMVARLIAVRGLTAVDAAGVAAIRKDLVDGGEPQSLWRAGQSTLDRDPNPEPLVNVGIILP